jgi:hypothetical protein
VQGSFKVGLFAKSRLALWRLNSEQPRDLAVLVDGDLRAVVENILYLGMPQTAERVLHPCGEKGKRA